jgi:hypothetical protein
MKTHRVLNPQALLSLYGGFPSLVDSELIEISVKRDEPRLQVKLMTREKPNNPSPRWPAEYDVVYLGISFIGTRNISILNWGHGNTVEKFDVTGESELTVSVSCKEGSTASFNCDWISIQTVTPGTVENP